ncbi:MAG: SRPBCC family protein [Polyangiaceae bacterium]
MKNRSTQHATFRIERTFPVAPARVFAAWSSAESKGRWFGGPEEWVRGKHELDFRVGGREFLSGGPKGSPAHTYEARYQDIVPNERILYTYEMHLGDNKISVSLATIEIKAEGSGTRLTLTEQGVFLDGYDDAGSREKGTIDLMDKLGHALKS